VARQQGGQHIVADGREAVPALAAQCFCHRHRFGGTAMVIVIRGEKYRMHVRRLLL
jgi:hypothetical protein